MTHRRDQVLGGVVSSGPGCSAARKLWAGHYGAGGEGGTLDPAAPIISGSCGHSKNGYSAKIALSV